MADFVVRLSSSARLRVLRGKDNKGQSTTEDAEEHGEKGKGSRTILCCGLSGQPPMIVPARLLTKRLDFLLYKSGALTMFVEFFGG